MIKGGVKTQLAAEIFTRSLTSMKNILKQAEDRYDGNVDSEGYKWYRGFIMDQYYPMLEDTFALMESQQLIVECGCGGSVKKRNGWRPCSWCAGSGYKNSDHYNDFLYQFENKLVNTDN